MQARLCKQVHACTGIEERIEIRLEDQRFATAQKVAEASCC
jgi:hypothetical protein